MKVRWREKGFEDVESNWIVKGVRKVYKNVTFIIVRQKRISHNFVAIARLLILALKTYYGSFFLLAECARCSRTASTDTVEATKEKRETSREIMEITATAPQFLPFNVRITVCKHVYISTSTFTMSCNGMTILNDTLSNSNHFARFFDERRSRKSIFHYTQSVDSNDEFLLSRSH